MVFWVILRLIYVMIYCYCLNVSFFVFWVILNYLQFQQLIGPSPLFLFSSRSVTSTESMTSWASCSSAGNHRWQASQSCWGKGKKATMFTQFQRVKLLDFVPGCVWPTAEWPISTISGTTRDGLPIAKSFKRMLAWNAHRALRMLQGCPADPS